MEAVRDGHESIARLLVDKGADVRAKDRTSSTVLHYAASELRGRVAVVKYLLEWGAKGDLTAQDSRGRSPVYTAARLNNHAIERVLREAGGSSPPAIAPI